MPAPDLAHITVERVPLDRIMELRYTVLLPGRPRHEAEFTGDDDPQTHHFAALDGDAVIGCASYVANTWEGEPAWQLRGMAIDPGQQRRGIGRAMVLHAERLLCESAPRPVTWCNARTHAVGFYERLGWRTVGEPFTVQNVGPHIRMMKRLAEP